MKWIANFFSDLGGSLVGMDFYGKAVSYPASRCWRFLLTLLFIISLIHVIHYAGFIADYHQKIVDLFGDNNYKVVFEEGVITNTPANPKFIPFESDTMVVWEWIRGWSDADSLKELHPDINLYIGPEGVFGFVGHSPYYGEYPQDLTLTVDHDYLAGLKRSYGWVVVLFLFLFLFIVSIIWSAVVILIFIAPVLAIKFFRIGLKFGGIWKLGMFLVSYHLVLLTIITLINVKIPYLWVYNFPLYILVIGLLVRIAPEDLNLKSKTGERAIR
jgi:hypothetical protein